MTNKPRFYLITAAAVLAVILLIVFVASSSGGSAAKKAGVATITIQAEIGVESIRIQNQNVPNGVITVTSMSLPFKFNCNKGDTLQFYVTTIDGYMFNAWWMDSTKTFNNGNPLTLKVNNDLTMTVNTFIIQIPVE